MASGMLACKMNCFIQYIYKLNDYAKLKGFTLFGETRMFEADDIVKQRTIL